jgi:hypothetical protein
MASWGSPEAGRTATNREGPTSRTGRLIGLEHLIRSHENPTDSIFESSVAQHLESHIGLSPQLAARFSTISLIYELLGGRLKQGS